MFENSNLELVISTLAYVASGFLLFFIGKTVFGLTHKTINVKEELVKKDNLAFAFSLIGYYIGLLIAIGSVIIGDSYGLLLDLMDIFIYGFLAIILLNITSVINDKLILNKFSITKEIIEDQNIGTGVVHAANYIASGLVIYGAVSGEGFNFLGEFQGAFLLSGIITAISFWLLGQVLMIITSYVYNMILPYDIHDHIEKDNVAVGVGYAGAIVSVALLISHGIGGDFEGWTDHFIKVGIEVIIGFILLPIVRFVTDTILLPGEKITDEIINQENPNVGASMMEAFAYIGGAVLIMWCL